jgi:Tfp pilus assembly protein PilO
MPSPAYCSVVGVEMALVSVFLVLFFVLRLGCVFVFRGGMRRERKKKRKREKKKQEASRESEQVKKKNEKKK